MTNLEELKEFQEFKKALKETLTLDNSYIREFAPSEHQTSYDKYENRCYDVKLSQNETLELAIDGLVANDDYLSEFVSAEMPEQFVKLIRKLVNIARS